MKLTKPQVKCLRSVLCSPQGRYLSTYYRPRQKLEELGYIKCVGNYGTKMVITDKGRAAYEALSEKEKGADGG